MLFFIDESWQSIGGQEIGALGGVGIPEPGYNHFCREVFAFKRDILGAKELKDCELRGTSCFAKSAFRKREGSGHSRLLQAAEKMLDAIKRHNGKVFLIWTADPALSLLRSPNPTSLSKPYKELLFDMRALMRNEEPSIRGALTFDQRHHREDEAAACAIRTTSFGREEIGLVDLRRFPTSLPAPSARGCRPPISSCIWGRIWPTPNSDQSSPRLSNASKTCDTSSSAANSNAW